jgi:hypothetical protein
MDGADAVLIGDLVAATESVREVVGVLEEEVVPAMLDGALVAIPPHQFASDLGGNRAGMAPPVVSRRHVGRAPRARLLL